MVDAFAIDVPGGRALVREPGPADEAALLTLFEDCEDWFLAATGLPSGPGDVQSLFYALPAGAEPEDKTLLLVEVAGNVVGLVDAVRNHPAPGAVSVGLFLLAPYARGKGLGRALAGALLSRAPDLTLVTATVPPAWRPGERFLELLGFTLDTAASPDPDPGNRRRGPGERGVRRAVLRLDEHH
ncbi:GNAT family N-acetyltransferase [Streptomyces olivochromogenes]|uniref:GNAT family N-acetyltransferase n=1 Tax=Streptomyces olivochromogenes TaxID=1963 RepID=UPI001F1AE76C|nr:GNAT family N-acetyltransferase [Streptomyces olivochromogenes]MCF3133719.1 GNAT family N-acetyltransferase [Streptomyces olivochromogenes]